MGSHPLLQGIFPTQSNLHLLHLLHCRWTFFFFLTAAPIRSPLDLSYLKYFCSLFPQVTEVSQCSLQSQKTIEESTLQIDKALTNGEKALAGIGAGLRSQQMSRFWQCLMTYLSGVSSYNEEHHLFLWNTFCLIKKKKKKKTKLDVQRDRPCLAHHILIHAFDGVYTEWIQKFCNYS